LLLLLLLLLLRPTSRGIVRTTVGVTRRGDCGVP
jgi:hypothetical protein